MDAGELELNAIELADTLSKGVDVDACDGYFQFRGTPIVCEKRFAPPPRLYSAHLVDLVVVCLMRQYHHAFVAALAYSRLGAEAGRDFWIDVYRRVSWVNTPSALFVTALSVCRHDMQEFVRRARWNMAAALQSNDRIDGALRILSGTDAPERAPWSIAAPSAAFDTLSAALAEGQVVYRAVDSGHRDLAINGVVALRVALRDHLFLALVLLYNTANGRVPWCTTLPRSAPSSFARCRRQYPALFGSAPP